MGLFDFLSDPSKKWVREPGLRLEVDLKRATLAGVALGSRPAALSMLGAPDNAHPTKRGFYYWLDLGIDVSSTNDILESYTLDLNEKDADPDDIFYSGVFLLDGKPLTLDRSSRKEDVVRQLGEPWHEYSDPDDDEIGLTLWYETRTLEWAFEFLTAGTLSSVVLASPPDMADEKTRGYLNCTKSWPP
jgi:hypothetical protein